MCVIIGMPVLCGFLKYTDHKYAAEIRRNRQRLHIRINLASYCNYSSLRDTHGYLNGVSTEHGYMVGTTLEMRKYGWCTVLGALVCAKGGPTYCKLSDVTRLYKLYGHF